VVLLAFALGTVLVLGYHAYDADRAHQEATQRTLEDFASVAAWEVVRYVEEDLHSSVESGFRPLVVYDRAPESDPLPPLDVLRAEAFRGDRCNCELFPPEVTAFRIDLKTWEGTARNATGDPILAEWVRNTLAAHLAEASPEDLEVPGLLITPGPDPRIVAFWVLRTADLEPRAVFGLVTYARDFARTSLQAAVEARPLLPPSVVLDRENLLIGEIRIVSSTGDAMDTVHEGESVGATGRAGLGPELGHLAVQLSLTPDAAWDLVIDGLPRSRRPYLIALLLLSGGLLLAALRVLLGERELARKRAEFVAGFSHEARTPLTKIRMHAQALRFGRLPEEGARRFALERIDEESRQLVLLLNNFLHSSVRENGSLAFNPRPLDLAAELEAFAHSLVGDLRDSGRELVIDAPAGIRLHGDPTALSLILRNLTDNAIKYGPSQQTIGVGAQENGKWVEIHVEDEGPGIPEGDREKVFEPYVRTAEGRRSGAAGSGLGLAVVRDLVQLHWGKVRIEEGRAGGARIVLKMPRTYTEVKNDEGGNGRPEVQRGDGAGVT